MSINTKSIRYSLAQGNYAKAVAQTLELAEASKDTELQKQAISASGSFNHGRKAYNEERISSEEDNRNLAKLRERIFFILEQLDHDFPNLDLPDEQGEHSPPNNTDGRVIHATNYFENVNTIENLNSSQKKPDKNE